MRSISLIDSKAAAERRTKLPCTELVWPQNSCSASGFSCSRTAAVTLSEFTVCEEACDWFSSGAQTHYKYLMSLVFLLIRVRLLLTSCHSAPPSPRCVWTSQTGGPQSRPCRMSALSTCWSITLPAPTYSHFWKSHLTSLSSKANILNFHICYWGSTSCKHTAQACEPEARASSCANLSRLLCLPGLSVWMWKLWCRFLR